MDTTQIAELLTRLETVDPAEAPDLADAVAEVLAGTLDPGQDESVPKSEPGGTR